MISVQREHNARDFSFVFAAGSVGFSKLFGKMKLNQKNK